MNVTQLPVEIWERIFGHLSPLRHLLTARLVCHRWKTIVDQKRSLWDRVCVSVPEKTVMDGKVRSLAPAPDVRLDMVKIAGLELWWPSVAERLTGLWMRACDVSVGMFLEMLRQAPNLERLEVFFFRLNGPGNQSEREGFRLEKLKILRLTVCSDDILDIFTRKCPQLQELSLDDDENHDHATARLIDSVQDTLERLHVFMTPYLLQRLSMMERLQLKRAVSDCKDDLSVALSRIQPSLEEFGIVIEQSSVLCEIGRNLTRLKRLKVQLDFDPDSSNPPPSLAFLATMPLLEKLEIGNALDPLDFSNLQCPNLTELVLDHVLVTNTLRSFLANSRNLQTLKFLTCAFETWSDLLYILTDHPSLQYLDLWYIQFENTTIPPRNPELPRTNLKFLQIYPVTPVSNEMLLDLVSATPQLKTLQLKQSGSDDWEVDDATVGKLCRLLPQLAHLELVGCSGITATCAATIVQHCPRLQRFTVDSCQALEDAVQKLLGGDGGYGGRKVASRTDFWNDSGCEKSN